MVSKIALWVMEIVKEILVPHIHLAPGHLGMCFRLQHLTARKPRHQLQPLYSSHIPSSPSTQPFPLPRPDNLAVQLESLFISAYHLPQRGSEGGLTFRKLLIASRQHGRILDQSRSDSVHSNTKLSIRACKPMYETMQR
jgi:hypothetical protein